MTPTLLPGQRRDDSFPRSRDSESRLDTATLLLDGKVLLAGIRGDMDHLRPSAELYDPASGRWTVTASMAEPRIVHSATLLRDGKVLVAGGAVFGTPGVVASAELYDPAAELDLAWCSQTARAP
jgi:hypothetical protein